MTSHTDLVLGAWLFLSAIVATFGFWQAAWSMLMVSTLCTIGVVATRQ